MRSGSDAGLDVMKTGGVVCVGCVCVCVSGVGREGGRNAVQEKKGII